MDPCCFLCRTPSGVCLTAYACAHHKEAEVQDEANHRARRTHRDPTADKALANVTRSPKPKTKAAPKRPFSYPKEDK